MVLCSRCRQYKVERFKPSHDDPLAQVCDECKERGKDEGNLTLEREWKELVDKLYVERMMLKDRIEHIDSVLRGLEAEGVLRVNKERMGEKSNG